MLTAWTGDRSIDNPFCNCSKNNGVYNLFRLKRNKIRIQGSNFERLVDKTQALVEGSRERKHFSHAADARISRCVGGSPRGKEVQRMKASPFFKRWPTQQRTAPTLTSFTCRRLCRGAIWSRRRRIPLVVCITEGIRCGNDKGSRVLASRNAFDGPIVGVSSPGK